MPLQPKEIRSILENRGLIKFSSNLPNGTRLINTGITDQVVDNNYSKHKLTVDTASNTITLKRVANEATDNNAVNIQTVDIMATVGTVRTPGYVYTGDFSGCVFYLYKTGPDEITGVHAYSGAQPVETKRFMKKKVVNMVVREFGPTDYYTRNPARMICRYPTRGEMDLSTGESSLSFLSCVEKTTATTFLFTVRTSAEGARVVRLLRTYHVAIL